MQIQSDVKTQRLLKLSSLIEVNCQYITVLKKCITDEQIKLKQNNLKLQQYIQTRKVRINEQGLLQSFIQIAYFIFSCRRYNIKPAIGKDDIRVEQIATRGGPNNNQIRFNPIIWYTINQQDSFQNFQSITIVRDIYLYLFTQFQKYAQINNADVNFRKYVMTFKKQCEYLYNNINVYQPNKQKQFFLCMEQTSVFKQWSSLLKIKNNSILDLIKTNEANLNKLKQCKKKDVELVLSYGNQKKKPKPDHEKVKQKQKQLQANVITLFKQLGKKQTEKNQTMVIQGQQSGSNRTQGMGKQQQKVKITYKFKQKSAQNFFSQSRKILPQLPLFEQPPQPPKPPQQLPQMQYIIQYSSDRNSICVRLIPNHIIVHIQNSDFLMYQSNILTFETVNVNIQLVQTATETKKNIKKLAFKGTSCLNAKQPPLEKILLLMDATMIAEKICEPEFNIAKVMMSGMNDHDRLTLISNKINHYTRIFLKCAKKVYSQ